MVEECYFYLYMFENDEIVELICYGIVEYYEIDEFIEKFDEIEMSFLVWFYYLKSL